METKTHSIQQLQALLRKTDAASVRGSGLQPLFESEADYWKWKSERNVKHLFHPDVKEGGETRFEGPLFLGIDSGSTTTKILILDQNESIVFHYYAANQGNSLQKVAEGLRLFRAQCRAQGIDPHIQASCSTGYGEELIKQAFNLDAGIVETMAHLQGAQWVQPQVSFILDIGGQDMKSIFVRDGVIANIELNEACSSGCGSFLQNFASVMHLSMDEFSKKACLAQYPADLGTRCTVFMNSKVKQSLRENASMGDIAAGLAYSVVKNCLFKVLKINNLNALGDAIVVQGGTFRNDAVYRALERLSGKQVASTDRPELMGALGAALYAKKHRQPSGEGCAVVFEPVFETREMHCKGCTNQCEVLRFSFENGNVCYSGNKCEKQFHSKQEVSVKGRNFFEEKNRVLFERGARTRTGTLRIGIPRVLNLFENFPFWHTLFEGCGWEVVLSPESTMTLYQKGISSVMSDNVCFPAKLAHGHILALVDVGVDRIFYPIVPKDRMELDGSCNSFNCPVVSGYPEVLRSAIDTEERFGIPFDKPVMTLSNPKTLREQCFRYASQFGVDASRFERAFEAACRERDQYNRLFVEAQQALLQQCVRNGSLAFVVAGRPYHADLLVNQKIGQILSDLGVHAFTEDVFRDPNNGNRPNGWKDLNLVSQWSYPNRVLKAAMEVAKMPWNVQLLQLNSFGCGPDSFLMEEVTALLGQAGKNHTILRIDEISSSGSIRLRLRSLIESLIQIHHANNGL